MSRKPAPRATEASEGSPDLGGLAGSLGIFLQARLDSTRLPRKVLLPLADRTVIEHAMIALRRVRADLYLLLTDESSLAELEPHARACGFLAFAGPKEDVLARFALAAARYPVERIVRATADNPLVSSELLELLLPLHAAAQADYSAFEGAPIGTGVEIVERSALLAAAERARDRYEREHVCPYLYRRAGEYRINRPAAPGPFRLPDAAVTLDTEADYRFLVGLFEGLYRGVPIDTRRLVAWLSERKDPAGPREGGEPPRAEGELAGSADAPVETRRTGASAPRQRRVLLVPSIRPGDGIGHLKRCIELARSLSGASILMPEQREWQERAQEVFSSAAMPLPDEKLCFAIEAGGPWDCIVLDRRATTREEYAAFEARAPVVGIDEGGSAREWIPYLIDTLPLPSEVSKANIFSPAFLSLPRRKRLPGDATGKILIAFGGEDPEGLSAKVAATLVGEELFTPSEITVARGPLSRPFSLPSGVALLPASPDLKEELHRFDIVFTSFGLTAYEAVNAGVAAILVNPTPYHRRLARIAGFPEAGLSELDLRSLKRLLADRRTLHEQCARIAGEAQRSIAAHLEGLDFSGFAGCPVCASCTNPAIERMEDRTFFRCATCNMVYEADFARDRTSYGASYFGEEYRRQYGKTYLEDFENIRTMGALRLEKIRGVHGPFEGERLIDVGCAYGPFLAAARDAGLAPHGVDISPEAARYVRESLKLPCASVSFEELDVAESFGFARADVLTMWYVIEHFPRLGEVLAKVNRLLRVGGVFAFSTPNLSGVSGYSDLARFLAASPRDHFTLWDPKIARSVLRRFGFRVAAVNITGHHPERFPLPGAASGWRYRFLEQYSRAAGLGDTFEIYAVKEREAGGAASAKEPS